MLETINSLAKDFLEELKTGKSVRIISHHDTDGITSAAILARTLKRLEKKFTIKITKGLDKEFLEKELKRKNEILLFSDLASGSLDYFQDLENPIYILDHHEIDKTKLNQKIKIANPHLCNLHDNECTGSGVSYLFAKAIDEKNKDLAKLALIGIIGDRYESNLSKINQQIIQDNEDLEIKKGLKLYPATRAIRRTLEYCTSPYIKGISNNPDGVLELLRDANIPPQKSLLELTEEETSRLVTSLLLKQKENQQTEDLIGNLYILKFFNRKEDVREISVLINACSRLGNSDIALAYCLENEKAKALAQDIYTHYKQELLSSLKTIEKIPKIEGDGFVIMNAKNEVKDAIIGTLCSMLSSSANYKEGTILIGMAYNEDKIKVSARIVGTGRNLKEVLEKTTTTFKQKYEAEVEIGGHNKAAGCLIEKEKEKEFIEELRKNLEIEVMKVN